MDTYSLSFFEKMPTDKADERYDKTQHFSVFGAVLCGFWSDRGVQEIFMFFAPGVSAPLTHLAWPKSPRESRSIPHRLHMT